MSRRVLVVLACSLVLLAVAAAPAFATMTENRGFTCHGHADITGKNDGGVVTKFAIDSNDKQATVPREGDAAYSGSVTPVTHNHSGKVSVGWAMFKVPVGDWGPSPNSGSKPSTSGTKHYSIPSWVPSFQIEVSGYHQSPAGRCAGHIKLTIQGSATGPVGLALLGGTAVFLAGFLGAGVAKK